MPTTYPEQTRFAFRPGVTCLTTPAGAVLLDPPHSQKLAGLSAGQSHALKTLNAGAATVGQLGAPADRRSVEALLDQLGAGGWLTVTVCESGVQLYALHPFGQPGPRPAPATDQPVTVSKFAILHRDSTGFVVEHPLSWCDVRIHDPRLLMLLDGSAAPDLPAGVVAQFIADLRWAGMISPGEADAEADGGTDRAFETLSWSAPDLWFHRRSTLGRRNLTWEHFGPTKWARDRFPQPPARRADYPGEPVVLPVPDLAARRAQDPTLTAVLEDRVSTRAFDDARPLTVAQLAELLYRTARTRATVPSGPGEQLASRPYPAGGGLYELELYPVVRHVAGLEPGMYHYDSFDHQLRPVAAADSAAVSALVKPAAATLTGGAEPQALIVIAARSGRIMWTYEQIGYATVLKNVGVLMQTIYLAATAMGVGVCAQGFSDTAAFVAATGVDELQECSVGSIVVGSVAAS